MKLIQRINQWWNKQNKPFPDSKLQIKYAFTVAGKDYFEMDDIFNIPYKRGMAAMSVYEELRMKCNYEFLKAHCDAVNNVLSAPKFNMASALQLKKLNDQLKERLTWVTDLDLAYKLAAVVFFDKSENPESYEPKYAARKIEHWKKHEDVADFFLRVPLQKLIPFLKDFDMNLQMYSQTMDAFTKQHWETIYSNLSEEQKKIYRGKPSTSSAEAILQN